MARRKIFPVIVVLVSGSAAAHAGTISAETEELIPVPVPRPGSAASTNRGTEADRTRGLDPHGGVRQLYRELLEREARKNGLPPDIADAVTAIESGYDPSAIGSVGEIGLMQVRPSTAAMLGFAGDARELAEPEINIRYGVTYLARAWRLADGDLCRALMKYRAGHGEEVMSPLSVQYCGRARAHLAAIGSPFADAASVPLVGDPVSPPRTRSARRGPRLRTEAVSVAFWAAHEARVRAITARIHARWRRMASR